ncbi:MAG: DUF86 domain-containing protein [Halanaerobiales bacterium]|nr:DUF86 domain-containing protein [Halanaerobiales bacterium]
MIDKNLINKKFKKLNIYIKQLRKYKNISKEELEDNLDKLWAVERGLQISIQTILDTGIHILSKKGVFIEKYSDVFEELISEDIIPKDFGNRIKFIADLRNILIFDYTNIDIKMIVKVLNNSLDDFEEYVRYINIYLEK